MKRKAIELDETSWAQWSPASEMSSLADSSPNRLQDITIPWARISKQNRVGDNYLNKRTRKRVRDNRPDMEIIHRNTLAKLFEAQRHPEQSTSSAEVGDTEQPTQSSLQMPTQRNLHSFFSIPQSRLPKPQAQVVERTINACEDCGSTLIDASSSNSGDIDMMDMSDSNDVFACEHCRRSVCDICSVRADHRLCLECALPGHG